MLDILMIYQIFKKKHDIFYGFQERKYAEEYL